VLDCKHRFASQQHKIVGGVVDVDVVLPHKHNAVANAIVITLSYGSMCDVLE
jgi:hypothetical protein